MTDTTTPNFQWPLPQDGDGQANGQTWGSKIRAIMTEIDVYLHAITAQGVIGSDTPPVVPNTWDDEFEGNTLNPAWTLTDVSTNASVAGGSLTMIGVSNQGGNIQKPLPRPFRIETHLIYASPHNYSWAGVTLILEDHTSGNSYNLGFQARNTANQGIALQNQRFTNGNWVSENMFPGCPYNQVYVAAQDNGTNMTFQISPDGINWATIRQEPSGTWMNPTHAGISWSGNSTSQGTPDGQPFIYYVPWIRMVSVQ